MIAFKTKKELKQMLSDIKDSMEYFGVFEPKTIRRIIGILEADAWCLYWQQRREELIQPVINSEKPNEEEKL